VPQEGGEAKIVDFMLGPEAAHRRKPRRCGAPTANASPRQSSPEEETVLAVEDLRIGRVQGVSFALRRGEILGLAALEGQGQDDLFKALAGEWRPDGGTIRVGDAPLRARHPSDAIRKGLVLVPADRLLALLPQRPISENVAAPRYAAPTRWGPINMRDERRRVRSAVEALQIDLRAGRQARRLSGGNQQKVTIARWLATGFGVLLCHDPTSASTWARNDRSMRSSGSSPATAPRSWSSAPSSASFRSSATAC
jgi:ribose transport system ATP-binding protein